MPFSPRQTIRSVLLGVMPLRMLVAQGTSTSERLYLTFDDGPHPEYTPRLLDALQHHGMTATFFLIGQEAERYPDLVRRIAADGHTLGTHSWSHTSAADTSAQQLADETKRAVELLADLTGIRTRLCRPPYGAVSAGKLWALWRLGQTIVLWSYDPKDFKYDSSDELGQQLVKTPPVAGDIVLLHDKWPAMLGCMDLLSKQAKQIGCSTGSINEIVPGYSQSGSAS